MKQWDGSAGVPPVELFGHLSAYYEVMELFVKWFLYVSHLTQSLRLVPTSSSTSSCAYMHVELASDIHTLYMTAHTE